jgi:hypothetical protein
MESQPLIAQKIDVVNIFLLRSLDFMPLNGDVGEKSLENRHKHIRVSINKALKGRTSRVECDHWSW